MAELSIQPHTIEAVLNNVWRNLTKSNLWSAGNFSQTFRDNRSQPHHMSAQFRMPRNVSLNAIGIRPQPFTQYFELTN